MKVFAPATISNIACGFDILGIAINGPGDEIIGKLVDQPGVRIISISGANGLLTKAVEKNTAGVAAQKVLEHLGKTNIGVELSIFKQMPFGSGIGSSAASAVAGAMVVNELFGKPLEKRELLPFAMLGEQVADGAWHADNVAPSLMGGINLIRDNKTLDVHRIPSPKGLYITVVHPQLRVLTKDSRGVLGETVTLEKMILQTGNLGGFVMGCYNSDFELIGRSLNDHIIEEQRAGLIEGFKEVKEIAMAKGALGCSISGAGPSVFALSANSLLADEIGKGMKQAWKSLGIHSTIYISTVNERGAYLC